MNDLPPKAIAGKFLVVGTHTDGGRERVFLWWNLDTPECAFRYAKLWSDDDREHGHESEYRIYDDRGNRADVPNFITQSVQQGGPRGSKS